MPTAHEQYSEQFRRWELRGRGLQVFPEPVHPEPPFVPFHGHFLSPAPIVDDGRRPTILSSLFRKLTSPRPEAPPDIPEPEDEAEPLPLIRDEMVELKISLPSDFDVGREAFEQFFRNLSSCREPIAFELRGTAQHVSAQFVAGKEDASLVRRQLQSYFPEAVFHPNEDGLQESWETCEGEEMLVVEFGLAREFMLPLQIGKLDPYIGLVGTLSQLEPTDLGLFQIIFEPIQNGWAESITNSVTDSDGKPFFVNRPELSGAAEKKVAQPLYAAIVRIAVKSATFERALEIAGDMAGSLRVFANPQGNELIPLRNDDYPFSEHIEDVLLRQSRRSGMILNCDELVGFVHLPSSSVRSEAFERDSGKTKAAPAIVQNATGLLLGYNAHLNTKTPVRLTSGQRVYHSHIIGSTGTGKSTHLFNLIRQDIENGEGVALLDPHGDLVDKILGIIPPERVKDVILVDPSDEEFSIGFNILSAHSDLEKTLLASDLVSVFQRLSTSWGDQMQSVLQNAILAFLNSNRGGTLADLRRFLVEPAFRSEFLKSVSDPNVLYYWHKGFSHLSGNKSVGPILTRLEMFLAQRPIALMVSQPENKLNFGEIMDSGKIFLAKLPEGLLGRENSYLLGALLVSKFQQLVMARQAKKITARRDFWIYIDEFANFITPTMAEILSGARKYRIGLTLAHHELHQLQRSPEVASAVLTHPYTRIVFRVGDDDAKKLADGFSFFEASDLKNLETGQAICRVERSSFDFNLSVPLPEAMDEEATSKRQQEVIATSRAEYGTPRADVEALLRESWEVETPKQKPTKTEPTPTIKPPPVVVIASEPPPVVAPKPRVSEIPKLTVSEIQRIEEVKPPPAIRGAKPPRDMGKGGDEHKAVQKRIKEAGEKIGFRSTIEHPIPGSKESVDLVLERNDVKIACETSFTTPIEHEIDNVSKCLKAGFSRIAIICLENERLSKIRQAVSNSLGSAVAAHVSYFTPDQFIAELEAIPQPSSTLGAGTIMRRGRPVKRNYSKPTAAEQKQREDLTHRTVAEKLMEP